MNSSFSHGDFGKSSDRAPGRSGLLEAEFSEAIRRARLVAPSTQRQSIQPKSWRKRGAIALLTFFTGQPQIAIRLKYVDGLLQWTLYDPETNVVSRFDSEQAVKVWLEQRYQR